MAVKSWSVGDVLTAADMNIWAIPRAVVKPSDQSRTSNTTLGNDNDLVLPVDANATYRLDVYLNFEAATGADLKLGFTFPAGLVARYHLVCETAAGATYVGSTNLQTSNPVVNGHGAGSLAGCSLRGTVTLGGTAGTLQLQWAQNVSNGTATIVHQYSHMILTRIG